eukprot:scaffold54755_cov32-Tisochrysis_lutea.AAC.5
MEGPGVDLVELSLREAMGDDMLEDVSAAQAVNVPTSCVQGSHNRRPLTCPRNPDNGRRRPSPDDLNAGEHVAPTGLLGVLTVLSKRASSCA